MQNCSRSLDSLQGWAERAARGRQIGRVRLSPRQRLVQQGQEVTGVGPELGELRGQLGLATVGELFEEQLGVADDVIQRRAKLVPQLRRRVDAHALAARPSSASIFSTSRAKSTGLVSKSSQPAPMAFSRSPAMACAVSAITGMARVSGAALI